jgi:hypothetical protein
MVPVFRILITHEKFASATLEKDNRFAGASVQSSQQKIWVLNFFLHQPRSDGKLIKNDRKRPLFHARIVY